MPHLEDPAELEELPGDDDDPGNEPASELPAEISPPRELIADQSGERLDRLLARLLVIPRNRVEGWIDQGLIRVDGRPARASQKIAAGQKLLCLPPPIEATQIVPEEGPLEILYEDDHLVVINKAAGVAVHPGAGRRQGTLANYLLFRYPELAAVGGVGRPGIVHRLDQGTTGVLLIARTEFAYQALIRAFAERRVAKRYLALVYGRPRELRGTIDQPIGRHPQDRQRMAIRAGGRPARTHYQVVASDPQVALLALDLETGRTHQIRVHAKSIGHPLVGDPVYGEARWRSAPRHLQRLLADFPRPALHARRLSLEHPLTGAALSFESPCARDFVELWQKLQPLAWPAGL